MPLSIARILNLVKELKYTLVTFQLADKSIVMPDEIIEDFLVQVDRFLVPADFILLGIEEDNEVPLILGRPFLATRNAEIRAKNNVVTFHIDKETVSFKVEEAMKHPRDGANCFCVDIIDLLVRKATRECLIAKVLENQELESNLERKVHRISGARNKNS